MSFQISELKTLIGTRSKFRYSLLSNLCLFLSVNLKFDLKDLDFLADAEE